MSRCKTLPVCNCQPVSSLTWGKNGAMTGPVTSSSLSSVTTTFTVEPLKPSTSKESMMQLCWKHDLKHIFNEALIFSLMEIFILQSFSFQVITMIILFLNAVQWKWLGWGVKGMDWVYSDIPHQNRRQKKEKAELDTAHIYIFHPHNETKAIKCC